jgi:hypothetical protein
MCLNVHFGTNSLGLSIAATTVVMILCIALFDAIEILNCSVNFALGKVLFKISNVIIIVEFKTYCILFFSACADFGGSLPRWS